MNKAFTIALLTLALVCSAGFGNTPKWVLFHPSGEVEVRDDQMPESDVAVRQRQLPLYTKRPDGTLSRGVTYSGASISGFHACSYPGEIIIKDDGSYDINMFTWSVRHGPSKRLFERKISGSDFVTIADPTKANVGDARGGGIVWTYDHSGAPASGYLSESQVRRAIARSVAAFEELLKDDSISTTFEFAWSNEGQGVLAFAEVVESAQSYGSVRTSIQNTYAASGDDADVFENGLYANFPPNSSISYARPGNSNDNTNAIKLVWPLRTKFTNVGFGSSLMMVLNADQQDFDADPSDGIGEWVLNNNNQQVFVENKYDLTFVLMHEMGHHFGFVSNVEALDFIFEDSITLWDIFRLGNDLGSISPSEFLSSRRELRDTFEANGVTQINQISGIFPLARGTTNGGDGEQASHWKLLGQGGVDIGLMRPRLGFGNFAINGRFLQPADIRAFDVMGYAIDFGDFSPIPEPELDQPINDVEVDPSLPLEFEWIPGSGSTSSDLLIYDLGTTVSGSRGGPLLVYRADDLSGGSLTIPISELQLLPGHRYQWHVAAYNPMGLHLTEPQTFIAECGADFNGDGMVNFFDLSANLAAFNAQDPAADLAEPFGVWNFFDITAYQSLFNAGCP